MSLPFANEVISREFIKDLEHKEFSSVKLAFKSSIYNIRNFK